MKRFLILVTLVWACGDDDGMIDADGGVDAADAMMTDVAMDDAGNDASDSGTDAGPDLCEGTAVLDPLDAAPAFAVIGTDFTSTTVGLLDADGDVHTDGWIDSGTSGTGLVATLGGDVVVPSTNNGTIDLLDRFGVDVGTRLCPNGVVVGQVAFSPGAFATNLHDWIVRGPNEAWATRYEPNPDSDAVAEELGNDLFGFDPTTMSLNGRRIGLEMFDETVTGLDGSGAEASVQISARPDTVVQASGVLVVGLGRIPQNLFGDVRGYGEGRVAIVDPSDDSVSAVELTGLANCGQVVPVAGSADQVLVSCVGYSNAGFGDLAGERATAGIARISIADGVGNVESLWRVSDDDANLLSVYSLISLGGDSAVAVAPGDFVTTNDSLMRIELDTGEQISVATGGGSFVLGQGAYDGDSLVLVPDTGAGIRRFDASDFSERESVSIGPEALPPTMIRAL